MSLSGKVALFMIWGLGIQHYLTLILIRYVNYSSFNLQISMLTRWAKMLTVVDNIPAKFFGIVIVILLA